MNSEPSSTRRPLILAITAGAVSLLAVVLYLRDSGPQETPTRVIERRAEGSGSAARVDRLSRLREMHEKTSQPAPPAAQGNETGKMQVPGAASPPGDTSRIRPKPPSETDARRAAEAAQQNPEVPFDEDPEDIPGLRQMALHDTDSERRLAAVTLLGASDDPQAIPILAQALQDQDEEVRLAAIQSLADVSGDVPFDALGNAALNDPSADNRYEALEVLTDLAGAAARPFLEKAAQDADEDVSEFARSQLENTEE